MKENKELERSDIAIDRDMEVDCDIGQEITAYIETWFDVDKKFGSHINDEDGTWLNIYGKYNPFADTLRLECEISRDNGSESFDYEPTAGEAQLIKDMITEKIRELYDQTPMEFCGLGEDVYVYKNRASLSQREFTGKNSRLHAYREKNGYELGGGISISAPMSQCGAEFQRMIDYCHNRGISKILVDSMRDIGKTLDEAAKVIGILCSQGLSIEVADSGMIYENPEETQSEESDQGFTMGGIQ